MQDHEVGEVLNALDSLWQNKPLDRGARAVWGAELSRHDRGLVMGAVMDLLKTEDWRPSLAKILGAVRKRRGLIALQESKRLALTPAPGPFVAPERVDELVAPVLEGMRPANVEQQPKSDDAARAALDRSMTAALLLAHVEASARAGEFWALGALAHVRAEREAANERPSLADIPHDQEVDIP